MEKDRRRSERFGSALEVRFRPTYGAKEYYPAKAVNISCDGMGLDADDFRFILYENLELVINAFGNGDQVSLFGDIVWKRQIGSRCLAGVQFRMKDRKKQTDAVDMLISSIKIPEGTGPGNGSSEASLIPVHKLGFIKHYYQDGARCTVVFRLLRDAAKNARSVMIVGDFNDWDASRSPMSRIENGDFVITIELRSGKEYRFSYLVDGHHWVNDWYADRFVTSASGSRVSVVAV